MSPSRSAPKPERPALAPDPGAARGRDRTGKQGGGQGR